MRMSRQESLERKRAATGEKAGAALNRAADALRKYVAACRAAGEQLSLDDDRLLTRERCEELGDHLSRVFGSAP